MEPERGWILIGSEPADVEAVQVCDGIFLSTSSELLSNLLDGPPPPRPRLLTGYAGWDAGQLEAELATSAWLHAEIDLNIIFVDQKIKKPEITLTRKLEFSIRKLKSRKLL